MTSIHDTPPRSLAKLRPRLSRPRSSLPPAPGDAFVRAPVDSKASLKICRMKSLNELLAPGVIDHDTCVIFDLDKTLILNLRPPGALNNTPRITALVEPITAELVKSLQNSGQTIFGLTARRPEFSVHRGGLRQLVNNMVLTQQQCASVGLDLTMTSPIAPGGYFNVPHPAGYYCGVVYCGQNSKGALLAEILARWPMKKIVMVDDNIDNFPSVIRAARAAKVALTCVHYMGAAGLPPWLSMDGIFHRISWGVLKIFKSTIVYR